MKKNIEEADFNETGYSYTLSLISGKYKPIILYCLMEYEPVRFNEMQRYLKNIADKTLSSNLKELEKDGLILRKVYEQSPPKVEYSLSEKGHSLVKVLDRLCEWGIENRPKQSKNRSSLGRIGDLLKFDQVVIGVEEEKGIDRKAWMHGRSFIYFGLVFEFLIFC